MLKLISKMVLFKLLPLPKFAFFTNAHLRVHKNASWTHLKYVIKY